MRKFYNPEIDEKEAVAVALETFSNWLADNTENLEEEEQEYLSECEWLLMRMLKNMN